MKVIAIGATGFIGRYVVTKLVEAGHEVAVLHRGKTPWPACKGVSEIRGERSTISELRNEFRTWSPGRRDDWPDKPTSAVVLTNGINALLTMINESKGLDWFLRLLLDDNFSWRDN